MPFGKLRSSPASTHGIFRGPRHRSAAAVGRVLDARAVARRMATAFALLCLLCAQSHWALAQQDDEERPALITADEINYDQELGVITAVGNVEVSRDERVLLADTVSYNERTDVVTASGNVSLLEPSGEVLFADFVELTGDLQEGVVQALKVLFADGRTRMAAVSGQRVEGRRTVLNNAVYSPCELCQKDPQLP